MQPNQTVVGPFFGH